MARMRWVDHWIGMPICFALGVCITVLRRLGLRRRREITGKGTIAVFKFFGLGSILQATPLLRALRDRYPNAQLAFVTFEDNAHFVSQLGICTHVRTIRTRSFTLFAYDTFRQMLWLIGQRVEAAVDLEFFSKFSTLLTFFSMARIRTGFHLNDFWRYSLVTHPLYFNYYRHITDVYCQAARVLDADITNTAISRLSPDDSCRASVRDFLSQSDAGPNRKVLGVNVNAGVMCTERRWPLDRFAHVLDRLAERHDDLRFVLTGAPSERAYVESLLPQLSQTTRDRTAVAAGTWSLEAFVAALECFDAFLTTDSGPMHLAASVQAPMVSLWGPGRPAFYAPRYDRHISLYSNYECSPCLYMFTTFEAMWCHRESWCMQAIEPQTVLEAVERLIR